MNDLVIDCLDRLGDTEEGIWSSDEMKLYLQDGYDIFTRRTRCLYDRHIIENLPPVGNWTTDLERYFASQKSGWGLTDEPLHMTAEHERSIGVAGYVGMTYHGPANMTSPSERTYTIATSIRPSFSLSKGSSSNTLVFQDLTGAGHRIFTVSTVSAIEQILGSSSSQNPSIPITFALPDTPVYVDLTVGNITFRQYIPLNFSAAYGPTTFTAPAPPAPRTVTTTVLGGTLPNTVVDILRVTYDQRELTGFTSEQLAQLDSQYQTREGDPQMFSWDQDGIHFLRILPGAQGNAAYDAVVGSWGTCTALEGDSITVVTTDPVGYNSGGFGMLAYVSGEFPSGGPYGTPTRRHPSEDNIEIELFRTGRDLALFPMELPLAYQKYVIYWALHQALKREGPGQDIALAQHYVERFEMGVDRLSKKVNQFSQGYEHRFRPPNAESHFGIGDPGLPPNYPPAF